MGICQENLPNYQAEKYSTYFHYMAFLVVHLRNPQIVASEYQAMGRYILICQKLNKGSTLYLDQSAIEPGNYLNIRVYVIHT